MKRLRNNKIGYIYGIAVAMLLLAILPGVLLGATELNLWDALAAIARGNTDSPDARILIFVRLPRVLAGVVCGMALAVSGEIGRASCRERV